MTEVWFIHGNHDTDSDADYDHLFGRHWQIRNLHGRVAVVDGVRIAGLGGVPRAGGAPPAGLAVREFQRNSQRVAAGAIVGVMACRASTAAPSFRRTTFARSRSAPIFW